MTSIEAWNSTEGLPRQFLSSLRILFDILDEKKCGYVRLQDIETRWHEEGVKGLPSGVTDALRKVAPQNGYLSFERFVSGLKLAMLTSKNKSELNVHDKENKDARKFTDRLANHTDNTYQRERQQRQKLISQSGVSESARLNKYHDSNVLHNSTNQRSQSASTIAAVRPNNAHFKISAEARRNPLAEQKIIRETHLGSHSRPPPRPERTSPHKSQDVPPKIPPRGDTSRMIINELKNWQRRMNTGQQSIEKSSNDISQDKTKNTAQTDIYVNISQLNVSEHTPTTSSHLSSIKRRDSARRHTLTSGVDTNMLKRAKQLEDEKQMLMQGLAMVDQARTWYIKQIRLLEEKQKYIGKASHSDYNLEAMQERMNFEKARIAEVNHQIKTLIDSTEKGFPLHMNLAMTSSSQQMEQNAVKLIKDQNRQLTKEISQKGDRITQLEQEKAQLVRELFEAQSRNKVGYDDTTFS